MGTTIGTHFVYVINYVSSPRAIRMSTHYFKRVIDVGANSNKDYQT